jgi:hypothetical protein
MTKKKIKIMVAGQVVGEVEYSKSDPSWNKLFKPRKSRRKYCLCA